MHPPEPMVLPMINRRTVILAAAAGLATFSAGSLVIEGWSWSRFGTPRAGLALLRGHSLLIEPDAFAVGPLAPEEEIRLTLHAINLSSREIPVLGFGAYCGRDGCVDGEDPYPLVIGPGMDRRLTLRVRAPREKNRTFRLSAELFTGVGTREIVITGRTDTQVVDRLPPHRRTV